jgi:hypothetical protein
MLPMAITWYSFESAYGDPAYVPGKLGAPLIRLRQSIGASLAALKADVPTKLAFMKSAVTIDPSSTGSRVYGEYGVDTVYLIRPLSDRTQRIIVILSSSSPESTTIFTFDDQLRSRLIYDSMTHNEYAGGRRCNPLGQIVGARVDQKDVITLFEQNRRWSASHARTFELNAKSHRPLLTCGSPVPQ